jgi:hypothetical protein
MFVIAGDEISTPSQVAQLQAALNAMAGDIGMKHKITVLPHGSATEPQKPVELAQIFDELLMHQVLMAYEVMPAELGIAPRLGTLGAVQATGRHDQQTHERKGLVPLMGWLKDSIFDFTLHEVIGHGDMEWSWVGMEEPEDQAKITDDWKTKVTVGRSSIDEWRVADGEDPWGLPETATPGIITGQSYVPLGQLQAEEPGVLQEEQEEGKDVSGQPPPVPGAAPTEKPSGPGEGGPPKPGGNGKPAAPSAPPGTGGAGAEADKPQRPTKKQADAELEQLRRYLAKGRDLSEFRSTVLAPEMLLKAALVSDPGLRRRRPSRSSPSAIAARLLPFARRRLIRRATLANSVTGRPI